MTLLMILGMLTAQAQVPDPPGPRMIPADALDLIGRTAPDFELTMLDGTPFKLQDHRGKRIVLSFWASWCGPCRLELPALAELQKERDDVVIYAVNVDRDSKLADKFLAQVDFDLPIIWDPESSALGQYEVLSMPTMFLLDENLTLKWRKTGFSQANALKELIAELDK
jgi:thiol-disulfide isomerase/thioredoxin